ncbi:MAG: endonuclease [Bacteroidaceae bacterium]|nr:endonuclease [Bacteroidaceae bacterium]
MKRLIILFIFNFSFLIFHSALAQDQYYRKAEGLRCTQLKAALHDIIQPDQVLDYGGGVGRTWNGFWLTDQMEDMQVRDRYSNVVRYLNPDMSAVNNMNIEHIWANSWWGHLKNNAYCDLFNLYPADATANGRKSNNPIGVVDGNVSYTNGVTKVGKSTSYRADSLITVWEPADEWKGDFARTYFYMATCYSHMTSLWTTTEGLLTVDPNSPLLMRPWVYNLMLEWAEADPLDEIEQERCEAIYSIQGNRNPFVDYPELCQYIWGDKTDEQFYCNEESGAEIFVPLAGEEIDFGLQPLSRPFSAKVQVRGRGLSEGATLAVVGEAFSLAKTNLSAEEITEGTDVIVSVSPTEAGPYSTMLLLEGSGYVQQTPLLIDFVDGIPAYAATDIVCAVSSRRFNANWMNYLPGATYTLDVYTKDAQGQPKTFGTYTTTDTTYQVKNVTPSTTYYYRVSIIQEGQETISSNEVMVEMPDVAPVFTVSTDEIAFSATPGKPSSKTQVSVTAMAVPKYVTDVVTSAPFELSTDGEEWSQQLTLKGQSADFFVRFGGAEEEGDYEGEVIVSTEGLDDRVISVSCSVDASKSFFEDFETGSKGAYASAEVTCSAATWEMSNALIAGDDNAQDKKCVRMKGYVKSGGEITTPAHIMMLTDKVNGCDSLWFYAGSYGSDTGVKMSVSYSIDGGKTWTKVVSGLTVGSMKRYGYKLNKDGNIRLKFENDNTGNKRVNIDNIQMSDWEDPDGIESIQNSEFKIQNGIYDLSGRRVDNQKVPHRIIIQNNKKTIISKP